MNERLNLRSELPRWTLWILIGLLVVLALAVLLVPTRPRNPYKAKMYKSISQCSYIQTNRLRYSEEHDGEYPAHVASLIAEGYIEPESVCDYVPREPPREEYLIGEFDLMAFDGSQESVNALAHAINAEDLTGEWYSLGDYTFVRQNWPTHDRRIIAAWTPVWKGETRGVVWDDGISEYVAENVWPRIWATDAAARAELGLPPITPPAWKAGADD